MGLLNDTWDISLKRLSPCFIKHPYLFLFGHMLLRLPSTLSTSCLLLFSTFSLHMPNYFKQSQIICILKYLGVFVILGFDLTTKLNLNLILSHVFFLGILCTKVHTFVLILSLTSCLLPAIWHFKRIFFSLSNMYVFPI